MQILLFLITLPLALFVIAFGISNTDDVSVSFYPGQDPLTMRIYLLGLGMLFLGFLAGALIVGIQAQTLRLGLWREKRKSRVLEQELDTAHRQLSESRETQKAAQIEN